MSKFRKIVVDNIEYTWCLGRSNLYIKRENKMVLSPSLPEFTSLSCDSIERARWKGYFHVTPKAVAEYIKDHVNA